jgi:putative colanic acid biosynthesis UDP-glucose lipid carrier transferase
MEYMIRHFVKPGLTGWAQVNGYRGEIRENELLRKRVEFDTWYMENWSLYLDMRIILLTILVTIKGDKNAF